MIYIYSLCVCVFERVCFAFAQEYIDLMVYLTSFRFLFSVPMTSSIPCISGTSPPTPTPPSVSGIFFIFWYSLPVSYREIDAFQSFLQLLV